jgi:hypothetical protein
MPFDERLRFDHYQCSLPIEESGESNHCHANRRRRSPPFRFTLLEQRQLFSKKEVLGDEGSARG